MGSVEIRLTELRAALLAKKLGAALATPSHQEV